jgi:hypothetical protein
VSIVAIPTHAGSLPWRHPALSFRRRPRLVQLTSDHETVCGPEPSRRQISLFHSNLRPADVAAMVEGGGKPQARSSSGGNQPATPTVTMPTAWSWANASTRRLRVFRRD